MMLKRLFDIGLSLVGLIGSFPLWVLFSIAILLEDGWPIFYLQERVGKNGRIFKTIKFRSMIKDAEKESGPVQAVENDPRVTRIGRILRATAMDELPQLLNILKGDMSFVGPRALRPKEKEVHGNPENLDIEKVPGYYERLAVRPGLTGMAQVYLPTDALRSEKFKYDLMYIKSRSFLLDLKLIFLSFWITFRGKWESREKKVEDRDLKMINFFNYWFPPVAWMAFIFPTNDSLTSESTSSIIIPLLQWLMPSADQSTLEAIHELLRKISHFLGYGFLAFLLFRAFRSKSKSFDLRWIIYSGLISSLYGILDEYIQTLLPTRTGSFYDWLIDITGSLSVLGLIFLKNANK